tara:strand:+ start:199 stop:522 length:324 start_codon:yes stop_codon:yes gene_type:complete
MIRSLNIIIFSAVLILFNSNAIGETKPDCSQYSTKTYVGLLDKMRCKKGLPVKVRQRPKKFSDINFLGLRPKDEFGDTIPKKELSCDEYTTKTLTGLIGKMKCKKDK